MTTITQKKTNEAFLFNLLKLTRNWVWEDMGYIYKIENNQFITGSEEAYEDLGKIVTKGFMHKYIKFDSIKHKNKEE